MFPNCTQCWGWGLLGVQGEPGGLAHRLWCQGPRNVPLLQKQGPEDRYGFIK